MSIQDLFPLLVRNQLITPVPIKISPDPTSRSYDPNGVCKYHMGVMGHSTEKCIQLKKKMEDLLKNGTLTLDLLHQWKSAHGFTSSTQPTLNSKRLKIEPSSLPIPIQDLFPLLVKNQLITLVPMKTTPNPMSRNYDPDGRCGYHMRAIGHSTKKCRQLMEKIEGLIRKGILTVKLMQQWKLT